MKAASTPDGYNDPAREYLEPVNVERCYSIPTATLAKWRWNGTGPDYAKLGSKVLYKKADVDRWIAANTRTGSAS